MKKFFTFINPFIFRVLFDMFYILIGMLLIKIPIDAGLFVSCQFYLVFSAVILFFPPYEELTSELIIKLLNLHIPSEVEDDEDAETDAGDDEYIQPNTFKSVYGNKKIDAYFELVSPELCGCFQFFLLNNIDRTCGEYLEIIGIKPPFKVERNEIVIQQPDPYLVGFLDRNYDNGMFSFVRLVYDEYHIYYVYKVNFSKMKPYICGTLCNKKLYCDIKEGFISSTIDEITTDESEDKEQ